MNRRAASLAAGWRRWLFLAGSGFALALAGSILDPGGTLEFTYSAFVGLAGFAMGSLGLLMIGHLMSEDWVAPIRSEAEAAGLTAPLLLLFGIPLAFKLPELFPWADPSMELAGPRAFLLSPGFFTLRGAFYLLISSGLAVWLVQTRQLRRTSAIGLALMTPVMTLAAYDWVLSRDPRWWSSLFGFAFALSQLLAALAGAILITLLRPKHASPTRMLSLERALLTLSLLSVWTWFSQFLIVWLANLPREVAWYLERSDTTSLWLVGAAFAAMAAAILVLIPSGVSRRGMIVGSALVLLHHALHLFWILEPARNLRWPDLALAFGFTAFWGLAWTLLMRSRSRDADETPREL
jgi:hypothetical protein